MKEGKMIFLSGESRTKERKMIHELQCTFGVYNANVSLSPHFFNF